MSESRLQKDVRRIYRAAKEKRRKSKFELLHRYLQSHHDQVLERVATTYNQGHQIVAIPSTGQDPNASSLSAVQELDREGKVRTAARTVPMETVRGLPKHLIYIPMQRNRCVSDTTPPTFIPYLGEDRHDESSLLSLQDIERRRQLVEEGPDYAREETNDLLDKCLFEVGSTIAGVWSKPEQIETVLDTLADESREKKERIQLRFALKIEPTLPKGSDSATKKRKLESPSIPSDNKPVDVATENTSSISTNNNVVVPMETKKPPLDRWDTQYLETVDSYRALYCRRCLTYQCNVHGLAYKPNLQFQHDRAKEKEVDGQWPSFPEDIFPSRSSPPSFPEVHELTPFQKTMCKRTFFMLDGDFDKMSTVLRAPVHLLQSECSQFSLPARPAVAHKRLAKGGSKIHKYSVRHYNHRWYTQIEKAVIHPYFVPCAHETTCSEDNCSCVKNKFFCSMACGWGSRSPNFFRGCGCKGACTSTACTCFAAKRECDPDLCGCDCCQDPPDEAATTQACRNDNLRMRRHTHLLVAPSLVSGWGCFTKYDLKKGDFVHEYTGEIISQIEAEKRGQVDDAKNRSYLFNLSSDFVLDACRRGSKARFINHSKTPNCETRTIFVNGDQRIGFFACEDVKAGKELFFDYRYNVSINNELIDKAAKKPDWFGDGLKDKPKPSKKAKKKKK